MNKILSYLKFFLGWPITLISLYFVFRFIGPKINDFLPEITKLNPPVFVLGIFFLVLYFLTRSYLWQKLLREFGETVGLIDSILLWGASEMKRYTPGNIWSFLGRIVSFEKRGVPKKIILKLMLYEIEFFVFGCLIISLLGLPMLLSNSTYILGSILFVAIISVLFIFSKKVKFLKFLPQLEYEVNLRFLLMSCLSLVFFGLGNFFIANSIFDISLEYIRQLSGVFVFALLVGFLSLITPMGLGVREYVVTASLSGFLTTSVSALLSIYTRLGLILSEIIFLSVALIFYWRKHFFTKIVKFIALRKYEFTLALLIAIYCIYFISASFLRVDNFYTGRFDLGNMDQVVWNTIHGRIFEFTNPDGTNIMSRLGFHADFMLILISPFYLIWSNPKMLLLIQTIVLSSGALFTYLISLRVMKDKMISLVFSSGYLFYPALQFTNLFDFHSVTFATTFLLGAFYFMLKKRYLLLSLFLILAALTKEQIWIISSFFGLFLLIKGVVRKKELKPALIGGGLFVVSAIIFYYLVTFAIPESRGSTHFALQYYSEFGNSPTQIATSILFSPSEILRSVFDKEGLDYLYQLFSPLGFLSVFSPLYLVFALPEFLINLLSSNRQLHQIYYQYSAALTPFIFISSIYGTLRLRRWLPRNYHKFIALYILFFVLYGVYTIGPFAGSRNPNIDMFTKPVKNSERIRNFIASVDEGKSVSASNNLGAHFSQRRYIYTIPYGLEDADIVAFLLNDPYALPSLSDQKKMVEDLSSNPSYKLLIKDGDFVAFEKINK